MELGATEIVGLNVLGKFPSKVLAPFVVTFRATFAPRREVPPNVRVQVRKPSRMLGGLKSTLWGTGEDVCPWIDLGVEDAKAWLKEKPFPL